MQVPAICSVGSIQPCRWRLQKQTGVLTSMPLGMAPPAIPLMYCLLQVIDPVEDHLRLLKKIFDFDGLKKLLSRPDFSFVFDGLHGVAGPYATRIFVQVGFSSFASQSCLSHSNCNTMCNLCTATAQHLNAKVGECACCKDTICLPRLCHIC